MHSYGDGLLQNGENVAIADFQCLNPRNQFAETFIDAKLELGNVLTDFLRLDFVVI